MPAECNIAPEDMPNINPFITIASAAGAIPGSQIPLKRIIATYNTVVNTERSSEAPNAGEASPAYITIFS